jgi:hypothetical protein
MEQGNLYLVHNFSATRSKITIDATTSASEDLSLSLSLSLSAHFHENISKKKNVLEFIFLYSLLFVIEKNSRCENTFLWS